MSSLTNGSVRPQSTVLSAQQSDSAPLLPTRLTFAREPDRFFATVRERVAEHFKRTGRSRKGDARMARRMFLALALCFGAYGLVLSGTLTGLALFGMQTLFGASLMVIAVVVGHDATHDALSHRPWVNRTVTFVMDAVGVDSYVWGINHNRSHHAGPNVPIFDAAIDSGGFFRFHPRVSWRPLMKWQSYTIWAVYAVSSLYKWLVLDVFTLLRSGIGETHDARHPRGRIALFVLFRSGVFFWTLGIPLLVLSEQVPPWQLVAGWLSGHGLAGVLIGVIFQTTHLADRTVFPEPTPDGQLPLSFSHHILQTTADFSTDSVFWTFISGGLNHHVAHHLFPYICQIHLPDITRIVQETAEEFGLSYVSYPTVGAAIDSHMKLLERLGSEDDLGLASILPSNSSLRGAA